MLTNIIKKLNNQRGVTLIEILAVVIILGVLSAIAVPSVYGYIESVKETKFLLDATNIKVATENAYEMNPTLKNLSSGSSRNQKVTEAIAEAMGTTWYIPYSQMYMVTGISIPSASMTRITVRDNNVYLRGDHVLRTVGESISEALGYGKLALPSEIELDPSLKNKNIFWNGNVSQGKKGVGYLEIPLYSFED